MHALLRSASKVLSSTTKTSSHAPSSTLLFSFNSCSNNNLKKIMFPSNIQQISFYHQNVFSLNASKQEVKIGGEELNEKISENIEINTNQEEQQQEPVVEEEATTSTGAIRLSNIVGGETPAKYQVYVPPAHTNLPMNEVRELHFAVVQIGGHQYKVTNGDRITVNRIPIEVGTQIKLNKILLVGGKDFSAVGRPIVSNATVLATIEQHTRSAYTIAFKKRRRKNSKRFKGFQQQITTLRIDNVQFEGQANESELKVVCHE
ncbi:hypothetical protein C9374_001907 [Naegleria lovaniensis]|uniref:Large ribosomal subunit protein bL21m n=1 Tax=Naegleria lovaniensis TaxID=51637 RepID=A0AA88GQ80_NAELO|nr:uncharacterized protein C9374_001907 [Naegleria lovaniensis]KAG2386872.1 hypothetical protein C9374_001907 [Naegleria lovaniensis]